MRLPGPVSPATANMCTSTYPAVTLLKTTKTAAIVGVAQESDCESDGNNHEAQIGTFKKLQDSEAEEAEEAKDQVRIVTPRGKTARLPGPVVSQPQLTRVPLLPTQQRPPWKQPRLQLH